MPGRFLRGRRALHGGDIFLSLPSVEIAIGRVKARVKQGGHNVPEDVIRRRFAAGLANFRRVFTPLADAWKLYDNSGSEPVLLEWERSHDHRPHTAPRRSHRRGRCPATRGPARAGTCSADRHSVLGAARWPHGGYRRGGKAGASGMPQALRVAEPPP